MQAYRKGNKIILWLKTRDDDIRLEKDFRTAIYAGLKAEKVLRENDVAFRKVRKKTYLRKYKYVLEIPAPISGFEKFIRDIEKATKHRVPLYNADIVPEQMFLYKHDIRPCSAVVLGENIAPIPGHTDIPLKKLRLNVISQGDKIRCIEVNGKVIKGSEKAILEEFSRIFRLEDPDCIVMDYAFSRMPLLYQRLKRHRIGCPLNRWDDYDIRYRGGKSYWSYGQVRYQDFAVRLKGRFLVDTHSFVGTECQPEAIMELVQLSGTLFQRTASRSFGAVFQTALMREMIMQDMLVPYKEKPIEPPLTMLEMLKADRGGHYYDPMIGFHKDVAEIDFVSMFPWLIYNHNISADSMLTDKGPFASIPDLPVKASMAFKGLIPVVLKPFIDRRMHYKKNPTSINKERAKGLKWVLVSCYGYLRFREFKLGIPTSHMAICAYARETLLKVTRLAEEKGFKVVHAIVDSVFIKKKGITEKEVRDFCREIELETGIPIMPEGIFRWVTFLPSVIDKYRALPSTYYGVFRNGEIKARGIEIRQRSSPEIVKMFQKQCIEFLKSIDSKKQVHLAFPYLCSYLRKVIGAIPDVHKDFLTVAVRISKDNYRHNIPQKMILEKLRKKGVAVMPGQFIRYIYGKGPVLPEEYRKPDIGQYKKLLVRSLFVILQPFGYTRQDIEEAAEIERQSRLHEYIKVIHRYIPVSKDYEDKKGLSEKLIRKRLEKKGHVWRAGLIGILKDEIYPNVRRKYQLLKDLMDRHHPGLHEHLEYINKVHHGMPDFLFFGKSFRFVECKLQYEQLSSVQKKTIKKLIELGFDVEVHKVVDKRTKTRKASVYIFNGSKEVIERQAILSL